MAISPTMVLREQLEKAREDLQIRDSRIEELQRQVTMLQERAARDNVKVIEQRELRTELLFCRTNLEGAIARINKLAGVER